MTNRSLPAFSFSHSHYSAKTQTKKTSNQTNPKSNQNPACLAPSADLLKFILKSISLKSFRLELHITLCLSLLSFSPRLGKESTRTSAADRLRCQAAKLKSRESHGAARYSVSATRRLGAKKAALGIKCAVNLEKSLYRRQKCYMNNRKRDIHNRAMGSTIYTNLEKFQVISF